MKACKKRAYACVHGTAAAAQHFSNKTGTTVQESTVKSIKTQYKDELRKQRADTGKSVVISLPEKMWSNTSTG